MTEVTQVAAAAGHKLQFLDFSLSWSTKYTFWSGLIGGAFLTMASHGTDQIIVQRLLAARSERDSRRALLASGVIVLIQFTVSCSSEFCFSSLPNRCPCWRQASVPTASFHCF